MARSTVATGAGAVLVAVSCLGPGGASASASVWRPEAMAALGDSISAGFNACGWFVACRSRSWASGEHASVNSHYLRFRQADSLIAGRNVNLAVPGAMSADLEGQARKAVERSADYVTILVGANDVCAREESLMTSVATYRRNIARALDVLRAGDPGVRVFMASVPDVRRLWSVGRRNVLARSFWSVGKVCQSMLARPVSTAKADRERRERVRDRVIAYNRVLAQECAAFGPGCRFDGEALFAYPFSLRQISQWDYFHPNAEGQRAIAEKTFPAVQDWLREVADLPV